MTEEEANLSGSWTRGRKGENRSAGTWMMPWPICMIRGLSRIERVIHCEGPLASCVHPLPSPTVAVDDRCLKVQAARPARTTSARADRHQLHWRRRLSRTSASLPPIGARGWLVEELGPLAVCSENEEVPALNRIRQAGQDPPAEVRFRPAGLCHGLDVIPN